MNYTFKELTDLASKDGGIFKTDDLDEAYSFCKKIALGHYENFPVASFLIPSKQRKAVFAVYSFARIADDIADEHSNLPPQKRITALENMDKMLTEESYSPVFIALQDAIKKHDLPIEPFSKLLKAFILDINFRQPETWSDAKKYCSLSANPVGEIMLRLFKQYNENNAALSDCICTGLQLINFWQDLSIDIKNKRYYIPKEELNSFNVDIQDLQNAIKSINLRNCISSILKYTDTLFSQGSDLVSELKGIRFKFEIALTFSGGKKILDKLYRLNDNLLYIRPKLTKKDYLNIIINALKLVF